MRLYKGIIIIFCVILMTISIGVLIYNYFIIVQTQEYDIDLIVGNMAGFNLDKDKVHFGTLPPGNNAERKFDVQNLEYNLIKVNVKTSGEFGKWIYVDKNNFYLSKGESEEIKVIAYVPENAEINTYEGKLKIVFTRF